VLTKMKKIFLIALLCISETLPYSIHAQDATLSFLPPMLIKWSNNSTSIYLSPGLGFDYFNGLTVGSDLLINQKIKDWNISAGFGASLNILAAGVFASYKKYGVGYYATFYGNAIGPDGKSNEQIVGGLMVIIKKFSLRLENDFFGDGYDRWRTNAIEIGIGNFIIGTYTYTNMPDRENENYVYDNSYNGSMWKRNTRAYSDGEVYRSVFYVGYRYRNSVIRIGVNHPIIQDITQNGWHTIANKPYFYTPYEQYFSFYIYVGYYNPFSLFEK